MTGTPISGLILPFDLRKGERKQMFEAQIPDSITIVLHGMYVPYNDAHNELKIDGDTDEHLFLQLQYCIHQANLFGIETDIEFEDDDIDDWDCTSKWIHPTPEQAEWAVNGVYIQVSFYNPHLIDRMRPRLALATAMTLYDHGYCDHRDIDPVNHADLRVRAIHARDVHLIIGDLYRENVGVWCRGLADFRSMVAVKCHAVLMDRDPDTEYDRFIKAGGKYFLDYPTLCP